MSIGVPRGRLRLLFCAAEHLQDAERGFFQRHARRLGVIALVVGKEHAAELPIDDHGACQCAVLSGELTVQRPVGDEHGGIGAARDLKRKTVEAAVGVL